MKLSYSAASQVRFQFFTTLTLPNQNPKAEQLRRAFYAWVMTVQRKLEIEPGIWLLRLELGELGGRVHAHSLHGHLPKRLENKSTAHFMAHTWKEITGGLCKVRLWNPALTAYFYTLKEANTYEGKKFEADVIDLMLSPRLHGLMCKWGNLNRDRVGRKDTTATAA